MPREVLLPPPPPVQTSTSLLRQFRSILRSLETNIRLSSSQLNFISVLIALESKEKTNPSLISSHRVQNKYSETLLKIAGSLNTNQDIGALKQELFVAAATQQKFLQTEYSAVLVDNSFDSQTAKVFRQLRKIRQHSNPDLLADLKDAVAVCSQIKPQDQGYQGRDRNSYRDRGRYRGKQTDVYNRLSQIPNNRPDQQQKDA